MKASIAAAAELRSRIARGVLGPGDPLPVEADLVTELECSKPVVREALRILETEGLVEVRRGVGGGPRVRHPSISHTASTMGVHLQIGDVPVMDVWIARDRIIAGSVEQLARTRADVDPEPLSRAVEALCASVGDMPAFNVRMLDVGDVAVRSAGNATEHLLVTALRHIVGTEIDLATRRVDEPGDRAVAVEAEAAIADAWHRVDQHVRFGRARAARTAFERQAEALRTQIGPWIGELSVGEAAPVTPLWP